MLHAVLVSVALLASPTQWCGGGGGCCIRPSQPMFAPLPAVPMSIAPPSVDVLKLIRIDQYPQPVRIGLAVIAPRPLSNVMLSTFQVESEPAQR